ncbi:TPA: LOW QUALITY PROTEIN: hypothetical protein N0F65_001429 [Lagenidium giganteum]|uniref:Uncharacterized protein n=1 Tax=Lagenidium giganteum TaxID=4803 RepID=A0AAV2YYY0_9STRA|nr:TPA: LOW QUALITY PROTEIN: hypothetical protein N0F65_001429 [Lagenidium giganteum]
MRYVFLAWPSADVAATASSTTTATLPTRIVIFANDPPDEAKVKGSGVGTGIPVRGYYGTAHRSPTSILLPFGWRTFLVIPQSKQKTTNEATTMATKTVLITGSNRGIGLSFAKHYKREGWNVIGTARNPDKADELKSLGISKLLKLDTCDEASILKAAEELKGQPIDMLINNAGILIVHDLTQTTKQDMMSQFETNAVGPFLMTRALLPNLRLAVAERGNAKVVQVTSRMGSVADNGSGGYYGYRASKSALNMINKSLAHDLKAENITSFLVHPGYVATEMTSNRGNVGPDESVAGMTKIIAGVTHDDAGKFYHFQGEELPCVGGRVANVKNVTVAPTSPYKPAMTDQSSISMTAFTLYGHSELRDPTREELFTGPTRDKLPVAIQQLPEEDTACTFCGVSYFVFAEVQRLQAIVKKYKTTFRDFVRFLERERNASQALKTQVLQLRQQYDQLARNVQGATQQHDAMVHRLRAENATYAQTLTQAQQENEQNKASLETLQLQMKQAHEAWKVESALTEQKMRNEVLHLSSLVEKCRLASTAQEEAMQTAQAADKQRMLELEDQLQQQHAAFAATERNLVSERDELKQQLLASTERVELERTTSKQLETQLKALQQELSRIVANRENEHATFAQLSSEIATLKHQLNEMEKNKLLLMTEQRELHSDANQAQDTIRVLRDQARELAKQLNTNRLQMENVKQECVKELEKLRLEHGNELGRVQRDHAKSLEDLKLSHKQYLEFLEKEAVAIKANAEGTEQRVALLQAKVENTERQVLHWKEQAQTSTEQLQRQVNDILAEKKRVMQQSEALSADKERLERRVRDLMKEVEKLKAQGPERGDSETQWAWQSGGARSAGSNKKPSTVKGNQEESSEPELIQNLRHMLAQKDKVSYIACSQMRNLILV